MRPQSKKDLHSDTLSLISQHLLHNCQFLWEPFSFKSPHGVFWCVLKLKDFKSMKDWGGPQQTVRGESVKRILG